MDMTKMGAFLQQLRREHCLTQEQLGEKLSVSGKTISRWETGAYMPPVEMLMAVHPLRAEHQRAGGGRAAFSRHAPACR